nr:uncharacterized protein LOC117273894 [Nicotiana tomentosiformis]
MGGESSETYEDFEAEDSESSEDLEAVESTDPDCLTIPKCRGNIERLFASEESPFTMKSVQFDVLALPVHGVTISEYDKPKPTPVRGELSASVESLLTFVLEDDQPDWKCLVCLCCGEKGEELVEFSCREHHLHLECGKRLLVSGRSS